MRDMRVTPTGETYTEFEKAYDYFNLALFGGEIQGVPLAPVGKSTRERCAYFFLAPTS
jgi:hypothetical protein